jgi:hypothetical protein
MLGRRDGMHEALQGPVGMVAAARERRQLGEKALEVVLAKLDGVPELNYHEGEEVGLEVLQGVRQLELPAT